MIIKSYLNKASLIACINPLVSFYKFYVMHFSDFIFYESEIKFKKYPKSKIESKDNLFFPIYKRQETI